MTLEQIECRPGFEAPLQHERGSMREGGAHGVGRPIRPEEWYGQHHAVGRGESLPFADVKAVFNHRTMNVRHCLGVRGGARGVENEGHVIRAGAFAWRRQFERRRAFDPGVVRLAARRTGIAHHHQPLERGRTTGGVYEQGGEFIGVGALAKAVQRNQDTGCRITKQEVKFARRGPGRKRGSHCADR